VLKQFVLCITLTCSAGWAFGSQLPEYPFIHTSGTASKWIEPNIGEINFEVAVSDTDADAAVKLAQSRIAGILKLLTDQGIPLTDIDALDLQKKIRTSDNVDGKQPVVNYDIKQGYHVTVRDLSKWRDLIMPLLDESNVGNFGTSFDRTDRDKINDELITAAAMDAQRNGTTLAAAFGKHLGTVTAVSPGKLKDTGIALGLASANITYDRRDDQRQQEILNFSAPAAIAFMQSVDVIFRIK
jgi:uncharacterized protein YggE